jgi:hypothetical protein
VHKRQAPVRKRQLVAHRRKAALLPKLSTSRN